MEEVHAIIPARCGSRRLPGKNIKELAGKPLVAYTIEAAMESGIIDSIVVSTDDEIIIAVSEEHGASHIKRPAKILGCIHIRHPFCECPGDVFEHTSIGQYVRSHRFEHKGLFCWSPINGGPNCYR